MSKQIKKILIANRGEIACRVIKTARKMGIRTVAVYSDADRKALHVRMADEAVHIGPSPASESYLVIEKIIAACKETGADAVHPGYGFLSENPAFARALKDNNITFIGPAPESMEAMGLKDAAKKLMAEAGVPITPGYHGENQDPDYLKSQADEIGYPVLIKAVAGGGGKGMRRVEASEDFLDALASCQREAASSFGETRVLIEKYILNPRHIEVQVFGDTHGHVVHMFERDCSLQRRHQKVIEEAPAPGMTDAVRAAMTEAAVKAAQAVNYVGAGTVEFIVDGSGALRPDGFWFMEMNTRLQVEHPVTEMITGLDLVELQIRVAQGEKLPAQNTITMTGHAVEARLYAEDPTTGFLPSIGKLTDLDLYGYYDEDGGVRVDTGVETGDEISLFYDPMIAKLIAYAPKRETAIDHLIDLIGYSRVQGLKSNLLFIREIMSHDAFRRGDVETGFIGTYETDLIRPDASTTDAALALAACAVATQYPRGNNTPFAQTDGWRLNQAPLLRHYFMRGEDVVPVTVDPQRNTAWRVRVGDADPVVITRIALDRKVSREEAWSCLYEWQDFVSDDQVVLIREGETLTIPRYRAGGGSASGTGGNAVTAPMPGKIIAVNVAPGDTVAAGDKLIVMEAMKMEMSLEAPRDGVVASVNTETDALVGDGDVLVELEN